MNTTLPFHIDYLDLAIKSRAQGIVPLPGSKSISNRVLLLSALSKGETEITGILDSDDTYFMRCALQELGVSIIKNDQNVICISGTGGHSFSHSFKKLFLGNSGTAFRSLTAILAFLGGNYELFGTRRMLERPIGDLVDSLRALGATVKYIGQSGYPPLFIGSCSFKTDSIQIKSSISSQFLTGLLLAAPIYTQNTGKELTIEIIGEIISRPYIDMTLSLMKTFGIKVRKIGKHKFIVPRNSYYISPKKISIEGDASSASYFLALGFIGGGPVRVIGIDHATIQGDIEFIELLRSMGANIQTGQGWIQSTGPLISEGFKIKAFDLDFNRIPDVAMTAAILAIYADGPCVLRNIASWRVKETDRIHAMELELRKLGAKTKSGKDWLYVEPIKDSDWRNACIETWDDHRIAMCFSLAAFGKSSIRIKDPGCVQKTFPHYFDIFKRITFI